MSQLFSKIGVLARWAFFTCFLSHSVPGQRRNTCMVASLVILLCAQNEEYMGFLPGRLAQSVTCLATDACLTADPGVASSIPARYHTFVEIDHEIISTVILLPSADLFKKGCCQLQAKVCAHITG